MLRQMDALDLFTSYIDAIFRFMSLVKRSFFRKIVVGGFLSIIPFAAGMGWEIHEFRTGIPCPESIHFVAGVFLGCILGAPFVLAPVIALLSAWLLLLPVIEALALAEFLRIYKHERHKLDWLVGPVLLIGPIGFLLLGLLGWIFILDEVFHIPDDIPSIIPT